MGKCNKCPTLSDMDYEVFIEGNLVRVVLSCDGCGLTLDGQLELEDFLAWQKTPEGLVEPEGHHPHDGRHFRLWQEVGEHRPECPERKGRRQAALELAEQESVRSHSIIKMLVERE